MESAGIVAYDLPHRPLRRQRLDRAGTTRRLDFNIPSEWLPEEAQEGHVLTLEPQVEGKESRLHFTFNEAETKRRTEAAQARLDHLPKGPEGDLEL